MYSFRERFVLNQLEQSILKTTVPSVVATLRPTSKADSSVREMRPFDIFEHQANTLTQTLATSFNNFWPVLQDWSLKIRRRHRVNHLLNGKSDFFVFLLRCLYGFRQ